jgi:hypothetical protein
MDEKAFVPIYEKNGNRFFVLTEDFVGTTEQEAREIGLGSMLVECIFWGMTYTKEILEMDTSHCPHVEATLGNVPVGVIAGPLFDEQRYN